MVTSTSAGPRPSGRYGHSLNILGSKIYIFGGQVEGYFMNDLAAFDLNQLQMPNNRWEMLIPNSDTGTPQGKVPPARTNHSMVSYNDKMYLFGGTNGFQWFNDVWCYDPMTNTWTQLDCIGYIPVEREGHAAALVDDVMYIFGGRTEEGADLGDLAAFRITSRRWYTFQNMGPSPSPRSGHSMTSVGKSVVVLGGEPSSATTSVNDLAIVYVLDTNKIRYPNDSQIPPSSKAQQQQGQQQRRPSQTDSSSRSQPSRDGSQGSDTKRLMGGRGAAEAAVAAGAAGAVGAAGLTNGYRSPPNGIDMNGDIRTASPAMGNAGTRMPRTANGTSPPVGPPPQGQPPRPNAARTRNTSVDNNNHSSSPVISNSSQTHSPVTRDMPKQQHVDSPTMNGGSGGGRSHPPQQTVRAIKAEAASPASVSPVSPIEPSGPVGGGASSSGPGAIAAGAAGAAAAATTAAAATSALSASSSSASTRSKAIRQRGAQGGSVDSTMTDPSSRSLDKSHRPTSPPPPRQGGSGSSINPLARRSSSRNSQTVALLKELDSARNRNAWYASELELARKAGYSTSATTSPVLDSRATETFDEDDKPLIEALLAMRSELANVQNSVDKQAVLAAKQIAEAEKQRDAAIQEAVYAKAKLAAHIGNGSGGGGNVSEASADERSALNHKLAMALTAQQELQAHLDRAKNDVEAEKRSRQLADDTLAASQRRMTELETYKQQTSYEMERLKAELHSAQRESRERSVAAAEAVATAQMLRVDKDEFERQYNEAAGHVKEKGESFESLRNAMTASTEIRTHLEEKLEEERTRREAAEGKLGTIKAELEARTAEVESLTQKLHEAEEMSEKHANEARTHREAVLSGLGGGAATRDLSSKSHKTDLDRIAALVSQLDTAKALLKRHQQDADTASDRLRSAEERIAGLEAYQEQASREGVTIRRQLQTALRETQTLQAHNTDLQHQLTAAQLEANAVTVQHNTLKDILTERGISPNGTRSGSRSGTRSAGLGENDTRVRSLEQQLAAATAANEEAKQTYAAQASESEATYRDKLSQLENDYQSAVHYVKGTEKMLKQLKDQLGRYKAENTKLKAEVEELEERGSSSRSGTRGLGSPDAVAAAAAWESERGVLTKKIELLQGDLELSKGQLEKQLELVRHELDEAKRDRDHALRDHEEATLRLTTTRRDVEKMQRENAQLERRAQDAEHRVNMLLDEVDTSVDNYRRRSTQSKDANGATPTITTTTAHSRQDSSENDSVYGSVGDGARNSAALDNLANELETLRSHWEATNKNYRLSNAFDFDADKDDHATATNTTTTTATTHGKDKDDGGVGLSESLADWRKRLDG